MGYLRHVVSEKKIVGAVCASLADVLIDADAEIRFVVIVFFEEVGEATLKLLNLRSSRKNYENKIDFISFT